MNFKKTSRRDDLESLVYLLISLLKGADFLGDKLIEMECIKQQFKATHKAKKMETQVDMCRDQAACLRDFAVQVNSMGFQDTPDYQKLKDLLIDGIDLKDLEVDE